MAAKPVIRRGFVLDTSRHERGPGGWQLWVVEEGDGTLSFIAEEPGDPDAEFDRPLVIAALEKVLAKRNEDYVPIDPGSVSDDREEGDLSGVPTLHRSGDFIVYEHCCGERRYFPRAAARALLSALRGGNGDQ